ncbi:hypothetical protein KI387_040095 [Taxus chinensis]|uniref:Nudix hydrolase domain-containing protein n=1 Tax=Taxus chinensis TaxID=29808 RepID=A0AA38C9K1_TAXCH|nr:hypothetical protein KI387_040095 [Taxus chinensis]
MGGEQASYAYAYACACACACPCAYAYALLAILLFLQLRNKQTRMELVALVARTGRHRQRYDGGFRLVAGCIPYRYTKSPDACNGDSSGTLEVLMITPLRGEGLMFPKGGWENDETKEEAACREALEEAGVKGDIEILLGSWNFVSKRHRDEHSLEGFRKSYMFALAVTEQLDSWPEKDVRQRKWVTVTEAMDLCRKEWMREALKKCASHLSGEDIISISSSESVNGFASSDSLSQVSDEEPSEQSACEEMVSLSAASGSIDAISDDEAPSCLTEENANSSSER